MWVEAGKVCEWKRPRTLSVRLLWNGRATEAVRQFLRTMSFGYSGVERVTQDEDEGEDSAGEEVEPGAT